MEAGKRENLLLFKTQPDFRLFPHDPKTRTGKIRKHYVRLSFHGRIQHSGVPDTGTDIGESAARRVFFHKSDFPFRQIPGFHLGAQIRRVKRFSSRRAANVQNEIPWLDPGNPPHNSGTGILHRKKSLLKRLHLPEGVKIRKLQRIRRHPRTKRNILAA